MKICIIGTGAAGLIACNYLKNLNVVTGIIIIGAKDIPTIGVGESTTAPINQIINPLLDKNEFSFAEFIRGTDAVIKNGVMYKNWSKNDFLHYFKHPKEFSNFYDGAEIDFYFRTLANKKTNTFIHDLVGKEIYMSSINNDLMYDPNKIFGMGDILKGNSKISSPPIPNWAYHFDAGMFISFMTSIAKKDKKVKFLYEKVISGKKIKNKIEYVLTENKLIEADFFIFATGDHNINKNFLQVEYKDFSHILIANKALFFPLKYNDKKGEMHPYTVAKTMKNGWRWITPTWSRIGTGYVFSENHISIDQAIDEFRKDIGDMNINPNVVNFIPQKNQNEINENWCTLGMASGFLEPLDAPGLALTVSSLRKEITHYLNYYKNQYFINSTEKNSHELAKLNDSMRLQYLNWAVFIFSQYKTCFRNDSQFWKDVKNIKWQFYEDFMNNLDEINPFFDKHMIQHTLAGKDIQWKTNIKELPYKTKEFYYEKFNHYEFIKSLRDVVDKSYNK
jgi:tryptophan halogenase